MLDTRSELDPRLAHVARQGYNNYSWVKNTKCDTKQRHGSLTLALKTNLRANHFKMQQALTEKGEFRPITAPYLCPHCGYFHNGGNYRPLSTCRVLVICTQTPSKKLASTGSTPLTRRSRYTWNTRTLATSDMMAIQLLIRSGYTRSFEPTDDMQLYWLNDVVLPAEESLFWLLQQRVSAIHCYILDDKSSAAINLNNYC